MKFSSKQRKDVLNGVNKQELDVIVIGGGITGSGIALDGATRGLSTIVFEMQDFAKRYIKSFNEACTRWSTLFKTT